MHQAGQAMADIAAVLDRWMSAFMAKDVNGLRRLWDDTYDGLIYQAEEFAGPLTNWPHIRNYYREVLMKVIEKVNKWTNTGLWINTVGEVACAYTTTEFTMTIKNRPEPYNGTVRQSFVMRRVNNRWKIIHYHESLQTMPTPPDFRLDEPDAR